MKKKIVALAGLLVLANAVRSGPSWGQIGFDQSMDPKEFLASARAAVAAAAPAFESVKILDAAAPNEVQLKTNALPDDLKGLLAAMNERKLRLVKAVHSASKEPGNYLDPGFICAAETTAYLNGAEGQWPPHVAYVGDSSTEWENVALRDDGLGVEFVLGIAVNRSVVKIFSVKDGKASHYRIYSYYRAGVLSIAMIASSKMVNELEVWKDGAQIFAKQKHRFSGNGVQDRSKECLFQLQ